MALIADILLIAGALGATLYCHVLARRLRRFNDLEKGMGGAIAVLSAQVDEMTRALQGAQNSARHSTDGLESLTGRAEDVARRLELLVAALHDLPEEARAPAPPQAAPASLTEPAPAPMAEVAPAVAAASADPAPEVAPMVLFRRRHAQEAAE